MWTSATFKRLTLRFDEMIMDHAERSGGHRESADPGYWGWGSSGNGMPAPSRSRLAGASDSVRFAAEADTSSGSASALFGFGAGSVSSRSGPPDAPAQPSLLADPAVAEAALRSRPPPRHAHELFSTIEEMGGPHAVRMVESLLQRIERTGGPAPIRISVSPGGDGNIELTIGNRSFPINTRAQPAPELTASDITMELGPKPSTQRWNEEAKLCPSGTKELLSRVVVHMINHLLPAAKKRQEEAEEKQRKQEEADKKKQEEADKKEEESKKKEEDDKKKTKDEVDLAMSVDLPPSRATDTPVVGDSSNVGATGDTMSTDATSGDAGGVVALPGESAEPELATADRLDAGGEDTEMCKSMWPPRETS